MSGFQSTRFRDSNRLRQFASNASFRLNESAYRWWRLLITANNGAVDYTVVCEVQLRGVVAGTDLTSPSSAAAGAATASDDAGGTVWTGSAISAFDDNLHYGGTVATRAQWLSNNVRPTVAAPKWLKYDFGSATSIAQVAINGSHDTEVNPSPNALKDFKIQGSNDNVNWDTLLSPPSQTGWAPAEQRLFNL